MTKCKHGYDPVMCPHMHDGGRLDPLSSMYAPYKPQESARAALDRRVVELLERLLRGEHDRADCCQTEAQADRTERFEDECRALLAELKEASRA